MNSDPGMVAEEADYTLLVPYALTAEGRPVGAKHADKSTTYFCPECRKEVSLRIPRARRRRHFAHHHENANCPFQTEQKYRVIAKHQVYWAFYAWVNGQEKAPVLVRRCPKCSRKSRRPVAGAMAHVERDYRETDDGPVFDVALLNAEKKVCGAVMIYDSHSAITRSLVRYGPVPTLVVRPRELFLCPRGIPVYRESNTQPVSCPECSGRERRKQQAAPVASERERRREEWVRALLGLPKKGEEETDEDDEEEEDDADATNTETEVEGEEEEKRGGDGKIEGEDSEEDDGDDPFSIWNRARPVLSRPERSLHVFPLPEPEPAAAEPPPGFDPDIVRRGVICRDGNYRRPTHPVVVGCPLARREGDRNGYVSVDDRCRACEHFRGYDNNHSEKGLMCGLKE